MEQACDTKNEINNFFAKWFVKRDIREFRLVKNQTEEICKVAVQKDGMSLLFVKPEFMTEEICKLAVQQDPGAFQFVKDELKTEEICKLAVKKYGHNLKYVKEEKSKTKSKK